MPEYADLQTFAIVLLALIGFILTIDKLLDVFKKRLNDPKHDEIEWKHLIDERLKRGDEKMEKQDEAIDLILKGQVQMLTHMAYGNHTDELKKTIAEYQNFLIEERLA